MGSVLEERRIVQKMKVSSRINCKSKCKCKIVTRKLMKQFFVCSLTAVMHTSHDPMHS